jgi:hypothetical protein
VHELPKQMPEHAMLASLAQALQELPVQLPLHLVISLDLQSAQLEAPQYLLHSLGTEASHLGPQ